MELMDALKVLKIDCDSAVQNEISKTLQKIKNGRISKQELSSLADKIRILVSTSSSDSFDFHIEDKPEPEINKVRRYLLSFDPDGANLYDSQEDHLKQYLYDQVNFGVDYDFTLAQRWQIIDFCESEGIPHRVIISVLKKHAAYVSAFISNEGKKGITRDNWKSVYGIK